MEMTLNHLNEYPVNAQGNMMTWVADSGHYRPAAWMPNDPQELWLTLDHYNRAGRTATFVWTDTNGRSWEMFASDMVATLTRRVITRGSVHGLWHVVKRSTNYGLMPYAE